MLLYILYKFHNSYSVNFVDFVIFELLVIWVIFIFYITRVGLLPSRFAPSGQIILRRARSHSSHYVWSRRKEVSHLISWLVRCASSCDVASSRTVVQRPMSAIITYVQSSEEVSHLISWLVRCASTGDVVARQPGQLLGVST